MAKRNSKSNSSLPTNPPLKSKRWTRALIKKVVGRWVLVGWNDSPAQPGIVIYDSYNNSEPQLWADDGKHFLSDIDSPYQIIDIGPRVSRDCPYSKSRDGWSVEEG